MDGAGLSSYRAKKITFIQSQKVTKKRSNTKKSGRKNTKKSRSSKKTKKSRKGKNTKLVKISLRKIGKKNVRHHTHLTLLLKNVTWLLQKA